MWRCLNCKSQIDDSHAFCWQCGKQRAPQPETKTEPTQQSAAPNFASLEQLAPEPPSHRWIFRRGLRIRLLWYVVLLVIFGLFKILASQFFGTYGLYIFVVSAFVALIVILWRFFRRDKSEGVGLKLH
jgi:Flp pilus assembly protein TadB